MYVWRPICVHMYIGRTVLDDLVARQLFKKVDLYLLVPFLWSSLMIVCILKVEE
jgi:putative effector of murein hydrolase